MRKVLFLVTTLVISMFVMLDVNASNFKLDFVGNETFKEEVTLNLQVNNLDGFTGSCNGLCGLVGTLEYDKEKIEITEIKPLESFTLAQGRKLVLYKAIGVSSGTNILAIKIRNKELAAGETTTISLNNIVASDGDKDISTANISKTIKLEGKQNNVNSETQNKPSTSESTTNINKQNDSTSKKKKTEEKKSTNSYLTSITLSSGNIEFDKDVLTYDVVVSNDVDEITIDAKTENSKSTIDGLGKKSLSIGSNKIKLVVKAEDGSIKTYTINVYRESNDKDVAVEDNLDDSSTDTESLNITSVLVIVGLITLVMLLVVFWIKKNKKNN